MPVAIDVHIHPPGPQGESLTSSAATQAYFRAAAPPASVEEMAEYYARLDIFGVLFTVDSETATGRPPTPTNDYVADIVQRYPKQFVAFASVDPWKGKAALNEIERCAKELGVTGLKFMPNTQQFFPNDERFYPM